MKFNRKSATIGLVGLGLVGALTTGGVLAAQAAPGDGPTPQPHSPSSASGDTHQFGHMSEMDSGQGSPLTAAATYLGLSQADLQAQLQAGASLADIATAQGKSISGLEDALVGALETHLDGNPAMTDEQKATALEQMKNRVATMVDSSHTPGDGMSGGLSSGMSMQAHMGGEGMGMDSDSDSDSDQ